MDHTRFACVDVDATYVHGQEHRPATSRAVIVTTGVTEDGRIWNQRRLHRLVTDYVEHDNAHRPSPGVLDL